MNRRLSICALVILALLALVVVALGQFGFTDLPFFAGRLPVPGQADCFYLTDDQGNILTDDQGNRLIVCGYPPVACVPVFLSGPTNQSVLTNSAVTFAVTAGGTAPFTYQWYSNSTAVAGGTNSVLTFTAGTNAASFYAYAYNACGLTNSSVATLTVTNTVPACSPPSTTGIANQTALAGSAVTFSVAGASGTAPLTYQWYSDSVPFSGGTNDTITFTATATASISIGIWNACGAAFGAATLTVTNSSATCVNYSGFVEGGSGSASIAIASASQKSRWPIGGQVCKARVMMTSAGDSHVHLVLTSAANGGGSVLATSQSVLISGGLLWFDFPFDGHPALNVEPFISMVLDSGSAPSIQTQPVDDNPYSAYLGTVRQTYCFFYQLYLY